MPTKEKFFHKPETVNEMIGGNRILPVTSQTLVDVIDEEMKPGTSVVAGFDIIPDVDPIDRTPYWREEDSRHRSIRFLKRGPQVEVMKHSTLADAMDAAVLPYLDRNRQINSADLSIPMSGYGWWGVRTRQHRKVHLDDCINGAKIYSFSSQNQHDESRIITAREYNSGSTRQELQWAGGDFLFEVPSTSEDGKHDVLLYSVPVARGRAKHARVLDMGAEQSAKSVTKRVTKRYGGRELYFGKHAVAAYIEMARMEHEAGNPVPMQMCPFALPSQMTVDFYNRLTNRVMVQEAYLNEEGKERTRKRPLNKGEREILLWQFVAKHGPEETLFARGKLPEYSWNRMYAPQQKSA